MKIIVICLVMVLLGLLAAGASFGAEATRAKADVIWVYQPGLFLPPTCVYPSTAASPLGLTAAGALLVLQLIILINTGCLGCKRRSPTQPNSNSNPNPNITARLCSGIASLTFAIALVMLLTGVALNDGKKNCYVVKPGVFAGAGVLCLATAALGIVSFITLESEKKGATPLTQGGIIEVGQPQFPPANGVKPSSLPA
ncbi:uncharacterized protein LOC127791765 [Diospyros lotus]|uniref:uncharacterized protein LOC127791765 n=1 Tax=Diospyros lotus TaxID=55363 RepID=UPI0022596CBB|nr:uncharacterized protein LOC127791765 [Diospyros lotus]